LTCNCGGADINSTYRQCLVSMRNSTTYFTALTLFDTGAYTSFCLQGGSEMVEAAAAWRHSSRGAPCLV
jgi:hypothetical protein